LSVYKRGLKKEGLKMPSPPQWQVAVFPSQRFQFLTIQPRMDTNEAARHPAGGVKDKVIL